MKASLLPAMRVLIVEFRVGDWILSVNVEQFTSTDELYDFCGGVTGKHLAATLTTAGLHLFHKGQLYGEHIADAVTCFNIHLKSYESFAVAIESITPNASLKINQVSSTIL